MPRCFSCSAGCSSPACSGSACGSAAADPDRTLSRRDKAASGQDTSRARNPATCSPGMRPRSCPGPRDLDRLHPVVHADQHLVCLAGAFRSLRLGLEPVRHRGHGLDAVPVRESCRTCRSRCLIVGLVAAVALTLAHRAPARAALARPRSRSASSAPCRSWRSSPCTWRSTGETARLVRAVGRAGRGAGHTGGSVRLPGVAPAATAGGVRIIEIVAARRSRAGSAPTASSCRPARRCSCASARRTCCTASRSPGWA